TRFSRDWSSDVCSSDLLGMDRGSSMSAEKAGSPNSRAEISRSLSKPVLKTVRLAMAGLSLWAATTSLSVRVTSGSRASTEKKERSEERRVGKEGRRGG